MSREKKKKMKKKGRKNESICVAEIAAAIEREKERECGRVEEDEFYLGFGGECHRRRWTKGRFRHERRSERFFFLLCTCLFVNEREGKMMTKVGGVHIQRACAIFYLLTLIK